MSDQSTAELLREARISSLTVFCSASKDVSPVFFSLAEEFAESLVAAGYNLIYGGSAKGVMGHLASCVLRAGGQVKGVIPEFFHRRGETHTDLTEIVIVDDLMDRKRQMLDGTRGVVVLPGGIGTLDELFEVLALRQVGEFREPVVLLNAWDYWTPLLECLTLMREQRMILQDESELFVVADNVPAALAPFQDLRRWPSYPADPINRPDETYSPFQNKCDIEGDEMFSQIECATTKD